jgi:2'-5' RNA ligase
MKERIRTFVAVELGAQIVRALADEQRRLAEPGADVKWVRPESLHVTLKFLGDIARGNIGEVARAIEAAAAKIPPFRLVVEGVSFFPRPTKPRIVSVGVDADGTRALTDLALAVDEHLGEAGYRREERSFKAHITLGRVKSSRGLGGLSDLILTAPGEPFGSCDVDRVVLYMSELSRAGPTYTPLAHTDLIGQDMD